MRPIEPLLGPVSKRDGNMLIPSYIKQRKNMVAALMNHSLWSKWYSIEKNFSNMIIS